MVCGAGPGQMVVWVPRCLERLDPTHSSCQERRTLARVAQPKLQASMVAPRPPGPALRPGSLAATAADTPRMWVGLGAASNSTRGHSSFRNTGDSIELAETRLFGKQPHLWENTSRLRSLLSISLCFPKVKKQKQKEKKNTHFSGKGVLHRPRELHQPLPSLDPLSEVLREDAAAFLQLLVLVPVALLHTHEPAFILKGEQSAQVKEEWRRRALHGMHLTGDPVEGSLLLCLFIPPSGPHPA